MGIAPFVGLSQVYSYVRRATEIRRNAYGLQISTIVHNVKLIFLLNQVIIVVGQRRKISWNMRLSLSANQFVSIVLGDILIYKNGLVGSR